MANAIRILDDVKAGAKCPILDIGSGLMFPTQKLRGCIVLAAVVEEAFKPRIPNLLLASRTLVATLRIVSIQRRTFLLRIGRRLTAATAHRMEPL